MTLVPAIMTALDAGSVIQWLCPPPSCWRSSVNREVVLKMLNHDMERTDQCLAILQGILEQTVALQHAEAAGDVELAAWWRERLVEDYGVSA